MKRHYFIVLILGMLIGFVVREMWPSSPASAKIITVKSRNLYFKAETYDGNIHHGATIDISKPVRVTLVDGGSLRQIETAAETVNDLLYEENLALASTDKVSSLSQYLGDGMTIVIDRILDLEVTESSEIPYDINLEHDPATYYGREDVVTEGIAGQKELDFLITYKNGVEMKRKLLRQRTLQKPVSELRRFGAKIEVEETREGRASWYATKSCNPAFVKATAGKCAAHPFYEFGRYARVTAINSGKSVIVKINDRGPNLEVHPERVIDLDSMAYKELATLGSGTIAVKVELLKN